MQTDFTNYFTSIVFDRDIYQVTLGFIKQTHFNVISPTASKQYLIITTTETLKFKYNQNLRNNT